MTRVILVFTLVLLITTALGVSAIPSDTNVQAIINISNYSTLDGGSWYNHTITLLPAENKNSSQLDVTGDLNLTFDIGASTELAAANKIAIMPSGSDLNESLSLPFNITKGNAPVCIRNCSVLDNNSLKLNLINLVSVNPSGTVTRTMTPSSGWVNKSGVITVTLITTGNDFSVYQLYELIPTAFNVTALNGTGYNSSLVLDSAGANFTFILDVMGTPNVKYQLTPKLTASYSNYSISGQFKDDKWLVGTLNNSIVAIADDDAILYHQFDNNPENNLLSIAEVRAAVISYFTSSTITYANIVKIVNKFFAGTHIL